MLNPEDVIRLRHMLDAAHKAREFTKNCKRADLDKDEKLALAVVRLLEVVGEAAKSVSEQCRQAHPSIPWRQIAGTRNRLIHGYFDVDLDIVWQIVSIDLPALISHLEKTLSHKTP
jgi:uncharacterized protein with HEPN domain